MKTIVVKVGSSIIAPSGNIESSLIASLIQDIWSAEKLGYKVVLVSSGAIACGANKLGIKKKPSDKASLMALASLGQIILMDAYAKALAGHKKSCAQILLTRDDFDKRSRFLNGRNTINRLLEFNVLPIINENDAVSDDEIRAAHAYLAKHEGIFVEPASAASIAGLRKKKREGKLDAGQTIVCVLTGNGLKDPEAALAAGFDVEMLRADTNVLARALNIGD